MSYDPVLKRLNINGAINFPDEVFEYADELQILDLSDGNLTTLPDSIKKLHKLRVIFLSNNEFETIPMSLSECKNLEMIGLKSCKIRTIPDNVFPAGLRGLTLTDNKIEKLPSSIGSYKNLQKLMLAGNALEVLPEELLECKNLQLLRIPINKLQMLPEWIFQFPKLGWLADADNPYHKNDRKFLQDVKDISWNQLVLGEKIGESAINKVYRASYQGVDVAVKIYGAGITTDGLPMDDMNACLAAGNYPHIIGAIGRVVDTPDNTQGLVMPLIPAEFTKLGMPPDLMTLTRDVYSRDFTFSFVANVLKDVSLALSHFHKRGIMHGDIYAHNILSNSRGESFIGDFGAASLYEPGSKTGHMREALDVAGFGYLIDDLLSCCDEKNEKLENLVQMCLTPHVLDRPSFQEIESYLQLL